MNYPECSGPDCKFRSDGDIRTLMHSPLIYDRTGKPVGGGGNRIRRLLICQTCGRSFWGVNTEFGIVTKVPWKWEEHKE